MSEILKTCHESIINVIEEAEKNSPVEFKVVSGAITIEDLKSMFKKRQTIINPDKFVEKELKTKIKYKKELYKRVPNLVESKKDKSMSVKISVPGGDNNDSYMVIGHVLGTAKRVLKEGSIEFEGFKGRFLSFKLTLDK